MNKQAKLAMGIALMTGVMSGVSGTASAEISDNFRLEVNGVSSFFHDSDKMYYGQNRVDGTGLGKGWNNYTRVVFTYNATKDTKVVARLHSSYDNAGDFAKNSNESGAYFDQSYLQFDDKKANMHYIIGKKGMTLGQSMVYNSTGNLTGVQVSYGNFWDPTCFQVTYGDAKDGCRVWSAQLSQALSKATTLNATYVRGETLYKKPYAKLNTTSGKVTFTYSGNTTRDTDSFIDFGGKIKFKGCTLVGEWARNQSSLNRKGKKLIGNDERTAWFVELYTGPTNDFGSGLPTQKVGTHAFSVRYQDVGRYGTYVHNNTFYDGKKGIRFDYGMVIRKGLSVDFVYGRMQAKNSASGNGHSVQKGDWSNIFVAALNYKFR